MNSLKSVILAACAAISLACVVQAQDPKPPRQDLKEPKEVKPAKPAAGRREVPKKAVKRDVYPFRGQVESVNKAAMTITLRKKDRARVVRLDADSRLTKSGKPAGLDDIRPGEFVYGTMGRNKQNEEVIKSASFDVTPVKKEKKPEGATLPAK